MAEEPTTRWLRIGAPVLLILVWLVGGALGGPYFGRLDEVATNDQSSFLPASVEATKVTQRLPGFLGDDQVPAVVVATSRTPLDEAALAALATGSQQLGRVDGVAEVSPSIASQDGLATQTIVTVDATADVAAVVDALRDAALAAAPAGVEVQVTGPAGFTADLADAFGGIDVLLLGVALGAVLLILVVVYRSPLLPVLVLMTSVFALCVALLTVWWLAKADVVVLNGQVQGILFILVIGAATDYALLYVARFREAIGDGVPRWRATMRAWRGAAGPVLASGGTVIAALLCLLLSDLATSTALGPIGAIGIAFAVLSALTFLPALLAVVGRAAFWPFVPRTGAADLPDDPQAPVRGLWPRQARLIARRARTVWVVTAVVLLTAAGGLLQVRADGVPVSDLVLGTSQARDGQAALAEHFPAGAGSPASVIVPRDRLTDALAVLDASPGVASVTVAADTPAGQADVALRDGAAVIEAWGPPGTPAPSLTVSDGDVLLSATLTDPADSRAAEQTVRDLRTAFAAVPGALVGGATATTIDTDDTTIHDRTVIIPAILVVILAILMVLLRAVVAPLLLMASTVLSFGAALGVSALAFNHLFGFPGADPAVPLYGFVFLVALGVDYNIFLMSRVREEAQHHGTRPGIARGLVATGGVITSAGLVLAATFAALAVLPILFLAQLAFIVAFGVLLDTFVVRSLLVPAVAYDVGAAVWWPSRLDRHGRSA